jgi:hypothetical protein
MPFEIDVLGKKILVPKVDEIDLDEWQVVRDKTGHKTVPEFTIAIRTVDPLAWRTLIEIGVARNPDYARCPIGKINLVDVVNQLEAEAAAEKQAEEAANGGPPAGAARDDTGHASLNSATTHEPSGLPA